MKIVKLFVICLMVLAFAFGAAGTGSVSAQAGLTNLTSGMQVYNQGTGTATITITIYDGTGAVLGTISDTINAASSKTYFPITGGGLPATFTGSAVISSDQPVAAINNTITSDFMYGAATDSFAGGSTTFNLPLVMCGNSGFNTFFSVQNAGVNPANITITYNPGSNGVAGTETATIPVGASKTFDQTAGSATKNCSTLKDAAGKFIGGAVITSNEPVVASVMQTNTTNFKILMGYNGFTTGATTVALPLIMANNSGFYTGIQVQNVGTLTTDVTITYSANTGGSFAPVPEKCLALAPGKSCTMIQNVNNSFNTWVGAGKRYIGAATVTDNNAQPLVAIVNQVSLGSVSVGPDGTAYEGFDPTAATANVTSPLIYANNSNYYTGIQYMNVGTGSCNVTMTYGPNTAAGQTWVPQPEVFTLAANTSKTLIQFGNTSTNGSTVNNFIGQPKYVGSSEGVGTGTGCKLVAIVNQFNPALGDKYFTYNAFNH